MIRRLAPVAALLIACTSTAAPPIAPNTSAATSKVTVISNAPPTVAATTSAIATFGLALGPALTTTRPFPNADAFRFDANVPSSIGSIDGKAAIRLPAICGSLRCGWARDDRDGHLSIIVFVDHGAPAGSYVVGVTLPDGRYAEAPLTIGNVAAARAPTRPLGPSLGGGPALSIVRSFAGLESTQAKPPDVDIAVGPDSILLTTNDRYVLRTKEGALIASTSITDFYAPLGLTGGGFVDSEALYDPASGRYFVGASGSSGTGPWSAFVLAVSKSPVPRSLSPADWYIYALDGRIDRLVGGDQRTSYNVDGTALTVGAKIVVMTARMEEAHLGVTATHQYLKIRVTDKQAALGGTLADWRDIVDPALTGPALGIEPVHAIGSAPAIFFAVPIGCGFRVWALQDAYPADTLAQRDTTGPACVRSYARQLVEAPQPDGAPPLAIPSVGVRDFKGVYLNGSLYVSHMTAWDGSRGTTDAVRWAQVDVHAWPDAPSIVQEGLVAFDAAFAFYPAIAVDPAGDVALVYGRSSETESASVYVTGRAATDALGAMRTPLLVRAGTTGYELLGYGYNRWGDYFGAALDPADGSLWVSGQYATARDRSATWVAQVRLGP